MAERPKQMSATRFLKTIKEGYKAGLKYCFILGSGASVTSGIPSGKELMKEWRKDLLELNATDDTYIQQCAADAGVSDEEYQRLFHEDYVVKSEDYFTLYDLRFAGMPEEAYIYLQKLMENAEPSLGYYMLAVLLDNTENKLVITTNFDSLIEDTLLLYHSKHPLVVGHESLAQFIGKTENKGRPIVAKVHRDLYLRPLNRGNELRKLDEHWKKELRDALRDYIPIVIGYAGGDRTLMMFLEELVQEGALKRIYWCSRHEKESERIESLLKSQTLGYLVKIKGFDEIMFGLVDVLMQNRDYDRPDKRIEQHIERYHNKYAEISKSVDAVRKAGPSPEYCH